VWRIVGVVYHELHNKTRYQFIMRSIAGTAAKPPVRWCWACSRKLRGNFHRVVKGPDGHEHVVHANCARRDGLEVVPGKHLAKKDD
jgi:hypothetical protein